MFDFTVQRAVETLAATVRLRDQLRTERLRLKAFARHAQSARVLFLELSRSCEANIAAAQRLTRAAHSG